MEENLNNAITVASDEAKYDAEAKKLLSNKYIIAHILKSVVPEFKGMNIHDIIPLIEEPMVSSVRVEPGHTNQIVGNNTEYSDKGEGKVTFDIIFDVTAPSGLIKFIINIEAQKDEPENYDIINRAIYYIGRQISAQKERVFTSMNYNDIRQVYSIWICMNKGDNVLNHIHFVDDRLIGDYNWKGNINIPNIILIGISDNIPEHSELYELHRLLGTLFSDKIPVEEKIDILDREYDMGESTYDREELETMCNLGEGIRERSEAKGRNEERRLSFFNMYKLGISVEDIANTYKENVEVVQSIINEVREVN